MTKSYILPARIILCVCLLLFQVFESTAQKKVFPGADEKTPSKAQYFSWINNTNEGTTEEHTQINLDFFGWLKSEYGMQLDIYAFDAGAIDGKRFYGSTKSERFKKQFPYGFDSVYHKAKSLNIRLGVWGGPDGFGDTKKSERERTEQMVGLCKDYEFALFKFDAVCGPLRPEKEDAFINMMEQCRIHSPDLILLNHRLGLERAKAHATTFLWGGAETYIDVFMTNNSTAPHHRAGALSRGLVPDLQRLTEDHGVCISSCLDNWDDDLILQSFNRSLILAPEIYGNPWLLRDDEFPKLARIYNIHRKYGDILIDGQVLPEEKYGPHAVARGDKSTRLISLRNLSWESTSYNIKLDDEIGLTKGRNVQLIQIHPVERLIGSFEKGETVEVDVDPYRAALYIATSKAYDEAPVTGSDFQIVRNAEGKSMLVDLIGKAGSKTSITLNNPDDYSSVTIDGQKSSDLSGGKTVEITFPGKALLKGPHRKISDFHDTEVPEDVQALYEATVFSADNNALEVRSSFRSGDTQIPEVQAARDAYFNQETFVMRGIWDKNLFDSDMSTGFWPSKKYDIDLRIKRGALRLDLGAVVDVDEIIMHVPDLFSLHPLLPEEGNWVEVSTDLVNWERITYMAGTTMTIPIHGKARYLRFKYQPQHIMEIEGFYDGKALDRSNWRASNLFAHPDRMECVKTWHSHFTLYELASQSYLSVALNGKHGIEGAYVAARIDGELVGAPDRASSYPSNTWEYVNSERDSNYTYYIPLDESHIGKEIEVVVMAYDKENLSFTPEVWISSHCNGQERIRLELE
jgi:hypothetical protein